MHYSVPCIFVYFVAKFRAGDDGTVRRGMQPRLNWSAADEAALSTEEHSVSMAKVLGLFCLTKTKGYYDCWLLTREQLIGTIWNRKMQFYYIISILKNYVQKKTKYIFLRGIKTTHLQEWLVLRQYGWNLSLFGTQQKQWRLYSKAK